MGSVVQIAGALLILTAFLLAQLRVLDVGSLRYLTANLVGAGVLAVDAFIEAQWGFFLLEGVWAVASAVGLAARLRRSG